MKTLFIAMLFSYTLALEALEAVAMDGYKPLTPDQTLQIIESLISALSLNYVDKDAAIKYKDALALLSEVDMLVQIENPNEFKVELTNYLQRISQDGHLRVYEPETTERLLISSQHDTDHDPSGDSRETFIKIEHQPTFTEISFSSFPHGESYEHEAIVKLTAITEQRLLILDLRNNSGGSASTMRQILNCFFPEPTSLYRIHVSSGPDIGTHRHTSQPIEACEGISKTPMVVLVNENTASAAELMTLLLKNRGRAIIIGKRTYGAGRPVELFELALGYSVYIPISTIVDDVTNEGFELTGVQPNIEID